MIYQIQILAKLGTVDTTWKDLSKDIPWKDDATPVRLGHSAVDETDGFGPQTSNEASPITMFELTSSRLPGWVFARDISVRTGHHKKAPLNMRAEYERQTTKVVMVQ